MWFDSLLIFTSIRALIAPALKILFLALQRRTTRRSAATIEFRNKDGQIVVLSLDSKDVDSIKRALSKVKATADE